jgi:hypothetical protein
VCRRLEGKILVVDALHHELLLRLFLAGCCLLFGHVAVLLCV